MEILRVENLKKVYGQGENEVHALDSVSFSVEKGEFIAIVGPSGSGKSTLLHILGGVDIPTSGKVYMEGQDVFAQNEEQLAIFRRRQVRVDISVLQLASSIKCERKPNASDFNGWKEGQSGKITGNASYTPSGRTGEASSKPVIRRTAAKGFNWASPDEYTGGCAGRRADW